MVTNIQILRALAACLVVHAHASGGAGLDLDWRGGANGVDLFFVISGFIIAYVASLDADRFMTRRLVRIVPIYWASSTAVFVLVRLIPQVFRTVSPDPELFVRSLLFLPDPSSMHKDGMLHPTLGGGWTLNYEMYFYVAFWIALAISRRWAGLIASAALATVILAVQLTPLHDSLVADFYGSPIVLEFIFGIVIFHVVQIVEKRYAKRAAWSWLEPLLFVLGIVGLVAMAFNKELFGEGPRWIYSGIPAFVIVLAAVLLERVRKRRIQSRALFTIGDASYALYLIHAYVVFGLTRLLIGKRTFSEPVGQLITVGLVAISVATSIVVYQYFEKPVLRFLKAKLLQPKKA